MIIIEVGKNTSEYLFGWQEILTLIGFIITIGLGIVNILISNRNNNKSRYVNAVTSERIKWIDELKELLSEFVSLTKYHDNKAILEGRDYQNHFEKLYYLQSKIKLHLNYLDKRDERINTLIEEIINKYLGLYEMKDLLKTEKENRLANLDRRTSDKLILKVLKNQKINFMNLKQEIGATEPRFEEVFKQAIKEINNELKTKYGYKGIQDLINNTNKLVEISRQYIKEEWEKVKEEAK